MYAAPEKAKNRHFYNQTRLHETNFALLKQLLPNPHISQGTRAFNIDGHTEIHIKVIGSHKYTTELTITLMMGQLKGVPSKLKLAVRVYHDASVAEATHYQEHGQFQANCPTPNNHGYHTDEKHQANRLLQECLRYCLKLPM